MLKISIFIPKREHASIYIIITQNHTHSLLPYLSQQKILDLIKAKKFNTASKILLRLIYLQAYHMYPDISGKIHSNNLYKSLMNNPNTTKIEIKINKLIQIRTFVRHLYNIISLKEL